MANSTSTSISEFYRYYVEETRDGIVLDLDLSKRTDLGKRKDGQIEIVLTPDEVDERKDWIERKERLCRHYYRSHLPDQMSQADFMKLRVAAPCLLADSRFVSARSGRSEPHKHRQYPPKIEAWGQFQQSVGQFRADIQEEVPFLSVRAVEASLSYTGKSSTERSEEEYLKGRVLEPLMDAKLIGRVVMGSDGCQGSPDFSIAGPGTTNSKRRLVGESKSTHNLLLPMKAEEVADQYNKAKTEVDELTDEQEDRDRRPLGWSHVGHPVAQILGYMVLNQCRYGVLTSGSRTYFIRIKKSNASADEERVFVSDAWFIGQEHYLRAWAFFYKCACDDDEPLNKERLSQAWLDTPDKVKKRPSSPPSPDAQNENKRKRVEGGGGRGGAESRSHGTGHIPTITLNDFEVGQPIGYGRRGTTFSGTWNGEVVALKLFDTSKDKGMEAFEREIKAYEHLEEAWGRLVPCPKFIAEAFGVIYFGMQMAHHPPQSARVEDWDDALFELEEKYGFRHLDVDGGERGPSLQNRMILRDSAGGVWHIVVDLEEYEFVEPV